LEKMNKGLGITRIPGIVFGTGTAGQLGKLCKSYARKVFLVTGNRSYEQPGIRNIIEKSLKDEGLAWERYAISGEPSPAVIDMAVEQVKSRKAEMVLAVGGGSALDAGKAIAAMACEDGKIRNFLEGVGDRFPSGLRLPLIAVPTTAGTGSEATKNAVISEFGEKGFKKSLRHDKYIPDVALIDPMLSKMCSREQTTASGMDAFTQLLESYLSTVSNSLTDQLAYSGLSAISQSLERVFDEPSDIEARSQMAYAALISGITLADAGLGLVHGFAQPLGSLFPLPHGVVCGTLMGAVNKVTVERLRKGNNTELELKKYAETGKLFAPHNLKNDDEYVDYLLDTIERLTDKFKMPRLSDFGIKQADISRIIENTMPKNHPVRLEHHEMEKILLMRL
jgi:alcohol dehydrogenase class IV